MIARKVVRAVDSALTSAAAQMRALRLRALYPGIEIRGRTYIGPGCEIVVSDGARLLLEDAYIAQGTVLRAHPGGQLLIRDAYVGFNCVIAASVRVEIGGGSMIAEMVTIRDQDHVFDSGTRLRDAGVRSSPVTIGRDVWIGAKATILRGVTIGGRAVVGAGAVVTRDVPSGTVVAGVPARALMPAGSKSSPRTIAR